MVVDSPQDEGCPPISNSLESLFDKEGLRELGVRGLKTGPGFPWSRLGQVEHISQYCYNHPHGVGDRVLRDWERQMPRSRVHRHSGYQIESQDRPDVGLAVGVWHQAGDALCQACRRGLVGTPHQGRVESIPHHLSAVHRRGIHSPPRIHEEVRADSSTGLESGQGQAGRVPD